MNNIEKLEMIQKGVYMICLALVSITEMECCTYGFDDVVKMAENYIKEYEEAYTDGKEA